MLETVLMMQTRRVCANFFGQYGTVAAVRLALNGDGTAKGYCHVVFKEKGDAVAIFANARDEGLYYNNRSLRVDFASPFPARDTKPHHQLYFSGLRSDESYLEGALSNYKQSLKRIKLLTDAGTGQSTGTGFLQFDSPQSATEVLKALNGIKLEDGSLIRLSYAKRKTSTFPPRTTNNSFEAQ